MTDPFLSWSAGLQVLNQVNWVLKQVASFRTGQILNWAITHIARLDACTLS